MIKSAQELLLRLVESKDPNAKIVSTNTLTNTEIIMWRGWGKMYVDENGFGYIIKEQVIDMQMRGLN